MASKTGACIVNVAKYGIFFQLCRWPTAKHRRNILTGPPDPVVINPIPPTPEIADRSADPVHVDRFQYSVLVIQQPEKRPSFLLSDVNDQTMLARRASLEVALVD